jgi:membrane glycosyltransferase
VSTTEIQDQLIAPPARPPLQVEPGPRVHRGPRVFIFYSFAVLLTGFASLLFADLLWRQGWSASRTILLVLFSVLFLLAAIGCVHGVYGFVLRRIGERRRITAMGDYRSCTINHTSTALVFPIYNEDARRVCAGLRATYESLVKTGLIARFDFFILSDSTSPNHWVEEERRWFQLAQSLGAFGKVFYRRRSDNEGKKSGNIRDFLNHWGRRYRYFVVFDADSMMSGNTIVDLVKLMEAHPTVGLIQTAPALVNARSLFGRMQQFANRLYGPIFTAGLNFWSQDGGNYWGHNAIIRTEPFMRLCDLPQLPGKKPFGGHILSHDFVEAALLQKENWEVWFAWDLEGSYEEGPPGIIENAQRDRRWCQGNLQHIMLLFARGIRGVNRLHLTFGIAGYLAGPLWFLFMLTGSYMLWYHEHTGLSDVVVSAFTPFIRLDVRGHALLIFGISMGVIFLPKILSLVDLALDPARRREFGGVVPAAMGAFFETLFSTLHAPVQMLFHTKFVIAALLGTSVHWSTQQRTTDGTSWRAAWNQHWGHTVLGLAWGAMTWMMEPSVFWWFVPVLSGMVLSVPLSVLTSRESLGRIASRTGLFQTPEESNPPMELQRLDALMATPEEARNSGASTEQPGLVEAILDPYVNAIHVSLLREKLLEGATASHAKPAPSSADAADDLSEKLLKEGPAVLTTAQQLSILSDPDRLTLLHRRVWMTAPEELASAWSGFIRSYGY